MSTINTHTHTVPFVDGQVWMYSIQNTVSTRNGPSHRAVIDKTLCSLQQPVDMLLRVMLIVWKSVSSA